MKFYVGAVLYVLISTVSGFNLDVKHPVTVIGRNDSYFGYSLTVHQNNNLNWLLVGAPKDRHPTSGQTVGAAHRCERNGFTFSCNRLNIPQDADETDQWLGATVTSKSGTALVCAPRTGDTARGQCYFSRGSLSSFSTYIPFSEGLLNAINFCEVGFSAAFSLDGSRIYTGGPSCDANRGQLFGPTAPLQSLVNYNDDTIDISYFTYALASGRVINGAEGLVASIGFHANSKFAGKVVLLQVTDKLTVRGRLMGYQSGEQFGASLAVTDINNDGRDDIIIGAPYHTDYSKSEIKYEVGAVYVYYQTIKGTFQPGGVDELILKGQTAGGQFGYAVTAIGDANNDGYKDVAVGAPHEKFGNVYIYYGSRNGLRSEPGQIISGNSFSPAKTSFGFSFSSYDLDGNKYDDLIVGAFESSSIVYLPARPVVKMSSELTFNPEYVTLERQDCDLPSSGTKVSCSKLKYCLTYRGEGVPASLTVTVSIALDVKQTKVGRLLFLDTNEPKLVQTLSLRYNSPQCQEKTVYVKPDIRDKLSPMEVALMTALVEPANPPPLSPILDIYEYNGKATNALSIFKDCGLDLVCIPDLHLTTIMNMVSYVQGSGERLLIDASVFNAGEDAFGSEFYLHLPGRTLSFINTDSSGSDSLVQCFPPEDLNEPVLRCEIGNPLPAGKTARIRVILQPNPAEDINSVSFLAEANSTNKEETNHLADNKETLNLRFTADASLQLNGWSRPETLMVNVTALQQEGAQAPTYVQFYEVRNMGPSELLGTSFRIVSPTKTPEGFAISDMTAQPVVIEGIAICDPIPIGSNDTASDITVNCRTERISRYERVVVRLSARLLSDALIQQKDRESFAVTSTMTANVTSLPFSQDGSAIPTATTQTTLTINKVTELNLLKATPWWIPVVSAVAAVAILAIIVAVLYHFGFFKRNRPQLSANRETPEAEPLQEGRDQRPISQRSYTADEDSTPT